MGGQPGKPKPLGNPPIRQEPQRPRPIEEPPRPLPPPPVERPPLPMQALLISAMLRLVVEHLAQRLSPFLFVATEAVWSGEMGSHGLGSFP
jgi:hypothetical protein